VVATKTVAHRHAAPLQRLVLLPVRLPIVLLRPPSRPVALTTWTTTFLFKPHLQLH
jgi:hypothetical protein